MLPVGEDRQRVTFHCSVDSRGLDTHDRRQSEVLDKDNTPADRPQGPSRQPSRPHLRCHSCSNQIVKDHRQMSAPATTCRGLRPALRRGPAAAMATGRTKKPVRWRLESRLAADYFARSVGREPRNLTGLRWPVKRGSGSFFPILRGDQLGPDPRRTFPRGFHRLGLTNFGQIVRIA